MRRILLAVAFVALLTSSSAHAVGIDLNWDNCLFAAANRVGDKLFTCDSNTGGPFRIFGSIRTGVLVAVTGWEADLDIQVASPVLDPWWQMGSGECREGGISFAGLPADMPNVTNCNKTLMSAGTPIVGSSWVQLSPNYVRYRLGVLGTTLVTMSATTKYQLFRIDLNTSRTVVDSDTPAACNGCVDAACIQIRQVELHAPSVSPGGIAYYFNPELASFVTWQGAGPYGYFCIPTRSTPATWGQIRSLYR